MMQQTTLEDDISSSSVKLAYECNVPVGTRAGGREGIHIQLKVCHTRVETDLTSN